MTTTTEPESSVQPEPAPKPRSLRRRVLSRISIQSKLLVMLLLTSILSAAVVGAIGYQSGRSSLRASVFDRLTEIRAVADRGNCRRSSPISRIRCVDLLPRLDGHATPSRRSRRLRPTRTTPRSTRGNSSRSSTTTTISSPRPKTRRPATGVDVDALLPTSNAQKYLQAYYTAPFTDWDKAIKFDDARDGSAWSAANARYNDFFREIVTRFEFEDALLLDTRGNVVYSAYKGVDLGTNILTGPYRGGELTRRLPEGARLQRRRLRRRHRLRRLPARRRAHGLDGVAGRAAGPSGRRAGAAVPDLQDQPADDGGQAVGRRRHGQDRRDVPRRTRRPDAVGLPAVPGGSRGSSSATSSRRARRPDVAEDSIRQGGTTLVQPVATEATRLAQRGQSGTLIARRLPRARNAAGLCTGRLPGLHWSIIAKIDTAEAFAPVAAFTRTLVLSTAVIIFVVCLAAMLLARLFVRPIRRLEAGAQQISSGDYDVTLPVQSRDEFGDLTVAFNDMSRNLAIKEELLDEQRRGERPAAAVADARTAWCSATARARRPSPRTTRTSR